MPAAAVKKREHDDHQIDPARFYRRHEGSAIFGYSKQWLGALIRQGKIPKPEKIYAGGHASGWRGHVIIAHLQKLRAEVEAASPTRKVGGKR
jgi:predicted DNA-binding transcriptional regulator AlpA